MATGVRFTLISIDEIEHDKDEVYCKLVLEAITNSYNISSHGHISGIHMNNLRENEQICIKNEEYLRKYWKSPNNFAGFWQDKSK